MLRHFTIALALTLPSIGFADTQLDRLEALSETYSLEMSKILAREITNAGGNADGIMAALPDVTWDDAHRTAGTCVLDRYRALAGDDGIDAMLTEMEAFAPSLKTATLDSMSEVDMQPKGVSQSQTIAITRECGLMELGQQRAKESGFTDAILKAYSEMNN